MKAIQKLKNLSYTNHFKGSFNRLSNLFKKNLTTSVECQSQGRNYIIKNGLIVNAEDSFKGDVYVQNGKIVHISEDQSSTSFPKEMNLDSFNVIDAKGKYVIPGGIDPHTHMELPFMGTVSKDDFYSGSKAALAGGTTSFIDFVIPDKGQSLLEAYEQWRIKADSKVACDYSLHCAVTSFNKETKMEMRRIVDLGVSSFKVFLAYKGALMLNDSEFSQVLETCKELGAICLVHSENGELVEIAQKKILDMGITGPEGHYLSRPEIFEADATHKVVTISEFINSPTYVVHVMSKDAAEEITKGKAKGNLIFAETLASALAADGKKLWDKNFDVAAAHVMSPPINPDPTTKIELMKKLRNQIIDTVATDNCTFCSSQKRMGIDNFTKIPNGVNGIEDRLSIVWTKGVEQGLLSPSDFVRVTSANAAKIFNLYPKKGVIKVGADADLVIWDGAGERTISAKTHHQMVDRNIYEGMRVKGVNVMTMTNGRIVFQDGKFNESQMVAGSGKYLFRKPFGFAFERMEILDKVKHPLKFKVNREEAQSRAEQSESSSEDEHDMNIQSKNQIHINSTSNELKLEIELLKEKLRKSEIKNKNLEEKINKLSENNSISDTEFFSTDNQLKSLEFVINNFIPQGKVLNETKRIIYGTNNHPLEVTKKSKELAKQNNFEIKSYRMNAAEEQGRKPNIVKIGAIQNKIVIPTSEPILKQVEEIRNRIAKIIEAAYHSGVNVICLQECWTAPFFYCTREKYPWVECAEDAEYGPTTEFLKELARQYKMVIISPILERDEKRNMLWNTAVVIDHNGYYMGKAHKNHIPRVGDFNESTYYFEGETGNPVFDTIYGKLGINICYGRHHPLHWMALGLNGAEIVFNPSATVSGLSEHLWMVEARNAAIANSYFTVAINRVGTEHFPNPFTSADGKGAHKDFGQFYGSSYVASPDGSMTPQLSRTEDGLLITQLDLNLIRQIQDKWMFKMTMRPQMYAKLLQEYCQPDFKKQIIKGSKN
jgi:dihydropyrimidinase